MKKSPTIAQEDPQFEPRQRLHCKCCGKSHVRPKPFLVSQVKPVKDDARRPTDKAIYSKKSSGRRKRAT
jgi:hypothetical protein